MSVSGQINQQANDQLSLYGKLEKEKLNKVQPKTTCRFAKLQLLKMP
jgi:hypothetical protein